MILDNIAFHDPSGTNVVLPDGIIVPVKVLMELCIPALGTCTLSGQSTQQLQVGPLGRSLPVNLKFGFQSLPDRRDASGGERLLGLCSTATLS